MGAGASATPADEDCASSTASADIDEFFRSGSVAGLAGADAPRVIALPDGRALWLFQDGFLGKDDNLRDDAFAHNVGLVQSGRCFTRLDSPGGPGNSLIGSWVERSLSDWVWALDGEIGVDGDLYVFVAEVRNSARTGAATGARPVGTWLARFDLPRLRLIDFRPAPDASDELFGYAVVSDEDWTYLYGHCYRQFGPPETLGLDPDCSPNAYLARVPRGQLNADPTYWTSSGWSADRSQLEPVLTSTSSMPVSVERFGDVYVAVSDEGDWFGADVVVRTAPSARGPWTERQRYTPETVCAEACNNYGAFVLPWLDDDDIVVAQSNNSWDMRESLIDGSRYRISIRAVSVPGVSAAVAAAPRTSGEATVASTDPPRRSSVTSAAEPIGTNTGGTSATEIVGAAVLCGALVLWIAAIDRARRAARRRQHIARARHHHLEDLPDRFGGEPNEADGVCDSRRDERASAATRPGDPAEASRGRWQANESVERSSLASPASTKPHDARPGSRARSRHERSLPRASAERAGRAVTSRH